MLALLYCFFFPLSQKLQTKQDSVKTLKMVQVEEFLRHQNALVLKARIPHADCQGSIALVDCFDAVW
jgi:hypothetical protein